MTSKSTIALENFGIKKLTQAFWKQFFSAFLAGILVAVAFAATLIVICNSRVNEQSTAMLILAKVVGALLFSSALIGCCVFGASFFTGNCAGFISCMHRRVRWKYFAYDLLITFVGNYAGCALGALLIAALPIFYGSSFDATDVTKQLMIFSIDKVTEPWWQTLIAAIFCNILVLGSVITWVVLDNKAASMILICLFITAFVLSGYQHVVANMFVTSLAGFVTLFAHGLDPGFMLSGANVGKLFYNCMIPSTIGNVIGGIFLISTYYLINVHVFKHSRIDPIHRGDVNASTNDFFIQQQLNHQKLNDQIDQLDEWYLNESKKYKKEIRSIKRNIKSLQKQTPINQEQLKLLSTQLNSQTELLKKLKSDYRTKYQQILQTAKDK